MRFYFIILLMLLISADTFAQNIIRVLLSETDFCQTNSNIVFTLETEKGFLLVNPKTRNSLRIQEKRLNLIVKNNNVYLKTNNSLKKIKLDEIKFIPLQGHIILNKQPYQGRLAFKIDKKNKTLLLINYLNLNDYLYSVLMSESYQSWPMEMQKIQAIVCRSYAINCILQSLKNKNNQSNYDLKRSNFHQTYNGLHRYTHLREAIEDTKDIVLTHKNKVALTMFDACCGGIVPSKMKTLNFEQAPYLAREQACNYCKNYKLYKWSNQINLNELLNALKNNHKITKLFNNCGKLKNIYVTSCDKAGIAHKIKVICSRKNINISGQDLWESCRKIIKSQNFKIKKVKDKVIIEGKGFGHQLGLCQRGARELVKQGWDYKKILKFYYPKTKLAKLIRPINYAKI